MSLILKIVIICAVITFIERALPFIIFRGREIPNGIKYLGSVLPMAIIATLIFYCYRNISFSVPFESLPYIIAGGVTAVLYIWRRNTMLSIFSGTAICMVLTQFVFKAGV